MIIFLLVSTCNSILRLVISIKYKAIKMYFYKSFTLFTRNIPIKVKYVNTHI